MVKNEKQNKLEEEFSEVVSEQKVWKPFAGAKISGKIVKRIKSNYGSSFVLELDNETYLLPNHKVLEELLNKCYIGDVVRIECVGTAPSKFSNETMLYKVFVKKQ
jgi:hypothetical protein